MTAQMPEIITYKGVKRDLLECPLEYRFNKKKRKRPSFISPHTACWRGYIGEWLIEDDKLYLVDIKHYTVSADPLFDWRSMFDYHQGKVLASWYTGELRVTDGKALFSSNSYFESVYETEITIYVEGGNVKNVREANYQTLSKFDHIPRDNETKILESETLWLSRDLACVHEYWYWGGISGESLVFDEQDISGFDDERLEMVLSRTSLAEPRSQVTITRNKSGFAFVNFNFKAR